MSAFSDLGLNEDIQKAIDELGFDEPTPIQDRAIPELLGGMDVIGQAQTGTGKTAAFGLPLLQYLDASSEEIQAVVLTPTRELCIQVTQALRSYAEHLDVEIVAVFGGQPIAQQAPRLRAGAQVVVATVGRMKDLINRRILVLTAVRFIVLDEADEMLDLGFIEDVEKILRMCPSGRQTALFSATMPPPIQLLAERQMYDPVVIKVTPKQLTVDKISQAYVETDKRSKTEKLIEVLKAEEPEQAIIFCRTKLGCARLDKDLANKGFRCKALHGDLSQGARDGVMIAFKEHSLPLLVATDVAARGLDIEHVTHVINYDIPNNTEIYVHRIGRTGRVGRTGRAITFATPDQMEDIETIQREARTTMDVWEPPEERLEHAPNPRKRERARVERPAKREREKLEPIPDDAKVEADADVDADAVADVDLDGDGTNGGAPERESRPRRETKAPPKAETGNAKLFFNRGSRSDVEAEDIRWALVEGAVVPEDSIARIEVLERFAFVELGAEHADDALERLDGTKIKGKQVRVEYAKS